MSMLGASITMQPQRPQTITPGKDIVPFQVDTPRRASDLQPQARHLDFLLILDELATRARKEKIRIRQEIDLSLSGQGRRQPQGRRTCSDKEMLRRSLHDSR